MQVHVLKSISQIHEEKEEEPRNLSQTSVTTEFFEWSCRHFAQPLMRLSEEQDPESSSHHKREFRFLRNNNVRQDAREEQLRAGGWNRSDAQCLEGVYWHYAV